MPKRGNAPTKAEIEAIVRRLSPGKRVGLGQGIYVTRDSKGRVRFQWRARAAGGKSRYAGGTCDSYEEALRSRQEFLVKKDEGLWQKLERGRKMLFTDYAEQVWLKKININDGTVFDYVGNYRRRVKPYWKGFTLGQLLEIDDFSDYVEWLEKTCKHRRGVKDGQPAESAVERGLELFLRILNHAHQARYIPFNPYQPDHDKRRKAAKGKSKKHVGVQPTEIPDLLTIERIRLAVRGRTRIERLRRRALISVLAYIGLRPGEALFLRWHHILTPFAARDRLQVRGAVKDLVTKLVEGETKTGTKRDCFLWPVVLEELLALYEAEGSPSLDTLIFPNDKGGLYWWGNAYRFWYQALKDAGVISKAEASAVGAFDPYTLRHGAASLLFHTLKPREEDDPAEKLGDPYFPTEIARHMGHSEQILHDVYTHLVNSAFRGKSGCTVEETVRAARRKIWGAVPGDADYVETLYTTDEAAELTGIAVNLLGNRCRFGTLKAEKVGARYLISEYELVSAGLMLPKPLREAAEREMRRAA